MNYRAAKTTRVDLNADRTIGAGEAITVFGIVIANSSMMDAEVDISDAAGTKKITVSVQSHDSKILDFEFIADGGLQIDSISSDQVYVTVFHSHGGS
jgi:hypothetical protein